MGLSNTAQMRLQSALRKLILSGFDPDMDIRADLLSVYEEISTDYFDLRSYGYNGAIPTTAYEHMKAEAEKGRKIPCIKYMRNVTGLGLKHAKEVCENLFTFD